jgi:hypothetical protein
MSHRTGRCTECTGALPVLPLLLLEEQDPGERERSAEGSAHEAEGGDPVWLSLRGMSR